MQYATHPTLVLAAMPEELAPLRARLTDLRWVGGADIELESGRLAGRPVVLGLTGDGARNAREGAADALTCTGARALIAVGVAGALSPGLAPGELVIAELAGRRGDAGDGGRPRHRAHRAAHRRQRRGETPAAEGRPRRRRYRPHRC
jgi:hypothetical protein